MEFIKKYLKTPISSASEKGEQASLKFSIISLVIFWAYTFLCDLVSAWKLSTISFYSELDFGDKVERYVDYLFENEGIVDILKGSLITLIVFAVFVLFLFAVLKIFKKENADYLKISTTLLLTNLYIVPIKLVLGILGIFEAKFFVYVTLLLSIVYAVAFIILNLFAIHKMLNEEDHDKSFRMIMIAIIGFILLLALVVFLFGDDLTSSLNIIQGLSSLM
ncbi:MAG: hypothetical protein E7311_06655 [Clostridiales bacterium]|nr:hypothetical protein [Clostridiales bacterium]